MGTYKPSNSYLTRIVTFWAYRNAHRAFAMLGELYERQGLFEKALEHYSLGIASVHQPYGSDYTDRGKMHFRLGHCAEARADFKEALRWRLTRPEWEEINSCLAEINTYL